MLSIPDNSKGSSTAKSGYAARQRQAEIKQDCQNMAW